MAWLANQFLLPSLTIFWLQIGVSGRANFRRGRLLCAVVYLPKREGIFLGVLADGKVTHLRHGGLWFANFTAKFLDLGRGLADGRDADISGDGVAGMHSFHQ